MPHFILQRLKQINLVSQNNLANRPIGAGVSLAETLLGVAAYSLAGMSLSVISKSDISIRIGTRRIHGAPVLARQSLSRSSSQWVLTILSNHRRGEPFSCNNIRWEIAQ
jgi:hypothetical protein